MDSKGDASIDMEKLADSLNRKLKTLPYSSYEEHCIYRVPQPRRCLNPSDYTPQMVSIGPLHHGNKELKTMEENKLKYLDHFLQRTKSFSSSFFLRFHNHRFRTADDPFIRYSRLSFLGLQMRYDLYLVENQLPLFILNELFDLAKTNANGDIYEGISLKITTSFWFVNDILLPIEDENLIEVNFFKALHFLDLLILCLQPYQSPTHTEPYYQKIPGVMELHQAGIKFKSSSHKCLLDISFNEGILETPFVKVYDNTERLYRNLLTFENMHVYPIKYFNDFVIIMSYFVDTPKDADLLIQNEIVVGDSEIFSTVFDSLYRDCAKGDYLHYVDLIKDIQAYRESPWNRWKTNLKQNYFNTQWASISIIAAVILLLLTITQTICALIAL